MSLGSWLSDALPRLVLDPLFRRMAHPPPRQPRALPPDLASRAEDLTIPGPTMPMKAWLVKAAAPRGLAVFIHGWSSDGGRMAPLARHLVDASVSCLLLDLPGHGRTGRTQAYHAALMVEDLRAVADYLAARQDLPPGAAIVGYSFGGVGAIVSAATDPRWAALVVMATPLGPMEAIEIYLEGKGLPARKLRRPLHRVAQRIVGVDLDIFAGARHLPSLKVPALFVHGTLDDVVPPGHARGLHAAAPAGRAALVLVEGVGHDALLADAAAGRRVAGFVVDALSALTPTVR